MAELLNNQFFVIGVMSALIFGLTQAIKQIVKFGTKRIDNIRIRRMVNTVILLIPFGLGFVAEFAYVTFIVKLAFSANNALAYGTGAVSLYGIVERFFKVRNPYNNDEGKQAIELAENVLKDGKIDKKDISAVEKFIKKV